MAKEGKVARTKLNLITDGAAHVATIQKNCRTSIYDVKKVMTALNCNHGQAQTVIALAQIKDAENTTSRAAGR